MPFDYDSAATTYDDHRGRWGPYVPVLRRLAEQCAARRVLEIGCGTGNSARQLAEAHPCTVVGLDRSLGMLRKAREKGVPSHIVQACGAAVPVADGWADYVFACYVLHHIADLGALARECHRVLRPGGIAAYVTASHEFIANYPLQCYFPSFPKVDLARFPAVEEVETALRRAGFDHTGVETARGVPRKVDREYVEKVAARFVSTYALLPEGEFGRGLEELRADLGPTGDTGLEIVRESTIVWAVKETA